MFSIHLELIRPLYHLYSGAIVKLQLNKMSKQKTHLLGACQL